MRLKLAGYVPKMLNYVRRKIGTNRNCARNELHFSKMMHFSWFSLIWGDLKMAIKTSVKSKGMKNIKVANSK